MARSRLARVAGTVHAPAEARRFAGAFLASHHPRAADGTEHDAATVVSELVTNAVRAGAQSITIRLTVDDARLRIEVTDDVAGWPRMRKPRADDPTGRGLRLVAALADRWGVTRVQGTGKLVWATLRLV